MGSLWDASVKSFKTLFYKSTATRKCTFEQLSALLARIEACLNSRPLYPMPEDPTDLLALTPGHLPVGGPLLSIVEPEVKGELDSAQALDSRRTRCNPTDAESAAESILFGSVRGS